MSAFAAEKETRVDGSMCSGCGCGRRHAWAAV